MNDLKVWVGCLADYNAGRLHGEWFDLDDYVDAEDLEKAVKKQVLMTSHNPNVEVECPDCEGTGNANTDPEKPDGCLRCHSTGKVPSSEEWFIADHEGFPKGSVEQYTSFETLYEIKERLDEAYDEFGDDGAEILEAFEHCFGTSDTPIREIREAYRGEYESVKDFAYEFYADTSELGFMDHPLINYVDWEEVWKSELEQDFSEHNGHYFWSNWS